MSRRAHRMSGTVAILIPISSGSDGEKTCLRVVITNALRDRLEIYARVENATGKYYETVYKYGTLGRVAYAGLRATF